MPLTTDPSLTVLDVGHGNCAVLIETGRIVVFDAGPKSGLLEFLLQNQIKAIDLVLISHADADHIGGLIALLATNSFEIRMVRLNTDSLKGSDTWDDLVFELDGLQRQGKLNFSPVLTDADNGQFNSTDVQVEILGPTTYLAAKGPGGKDHYGRRITTNSISAVIRLIYKGMPLVLLTGDMDLIGLEELLRVGKSMMAPVVVFPHHGGNAGVEMTTFSEKLYDQVKPEQVVFSIGRGKYGTPMPEVIEVARRMNAKVKISCTQLSERCSAAVPSVEQKHLSAVFATGRDNRHCCAGSITIPLDPTKTSFPIWQGHQDFITSSAPNALCRR